MMHSNMNVKFVHMLCD